MEKCSGKNLNGKLILPYFFNTYRIINLKFAKKVGLKYYQNTHKKNDNSEIIDMLISLVVIII